MKEIIINHGFHPEQKRVYNGEHIYKVLDTREENGVQYFHLEHGAWVKHLGDEKYTADWTPEERFGRVEEVERDEDGNIVSRRDLGFMILRVDRSKGLL